MSLLDSLLLEPYPFQVWIAARTDGIKGSGTVNDPFDGSTQAKFDAIMATFQSQSNIMIRLGPGTFSTQGYAIGTGTGWQARPGMKLIGSGIDVTTLQLVNVAANESYYAIGHPLSSAAKVDYFEVSDLTIDCNLPVSVTSVACGAIRVLGDHVKIRRVKAKNWGTTASGTPRPCYVFSVIAALPDSGVSETVDSGIEECIAILPSASNAGQATALHVGSQEDATIINEGFAKSPFIKNCFVDCGLTQSPAITGKYRALSMGWCRGGLVEGNQIYNTDIGGPVQEKRSARDIICTKQFLQECGARAVVEPWLAGDMELTRFDGHLGEAGRMGVV